MYCKHCGQQIDDNADICIHCGKFVSQEAIKRKQEEESITKKGWFLAIICWLVGIFGVHRFLVGKIGTGVLWVITGGCFGIGVIVDLIMILCSSFTDKDGNKIPFGV
ncbi:MAG: TM2 domain-containing protein [Clostridia bacterium]|nr:TM2 domain-containing protein [Clostridia bacterium]